MLEQCQQWIKDCLRAGHPVIAPAISYYEAVRELERIGATSQIARLRAFCQAVPNRYLSLTDADIDRAARLWGQARNAGIPTASPDALNGDVLLVAQALGIGVPPAEFVIATTNVRHLSRFAPAELWTNIAPWQLFFHLTQVKHSRLKHSRTSKPQVFPYPTSSLERVRHFSSFFGPQSSTAHKIWSL